MPPTPTSPGSLFINTDLDRHQSYFVNAPYHLSSRQVALPDTPPPTPPSNKFPGTMAIPPALSVSTTVPAQRHTYAASSSPSSPSPSSPLTLPSLLADDDDEPHAGGVDATPVLATPVASPSARSPAPRPAVAGDHSVLNAMAQQQTPNLNGSPERFDARQSFPLLPPHHPLRKNLFSAPPEPSPPTTPKGHPLTTSAFPFPPKSRARGGILNPYPAGARSYSSLLSHILRVPRRARPFLLVAFSLVVFGFVVLSRAASDARQLEAFSQQHRSAFNRRYVAADAAHQAVFDQTVQAQKAEAAMQSSPYSHATEGISFASKEDELLALISFITSTTSNALPPLDPTAPLEPSAILGFDPTAPSAADDLAILKDETNALYPIVLFGRMRDPWHREIQKMLAEYKITPAPLVVDVDQRRDHLLFVPLLERLFGTATLPRLVLLGRDLGSYPAIAEMRDKGTLVDTLEASGAVSIRQAKPLKKGRREKERQEMERVLGPKPVADI
ncbi:hypothetical protein Q5752_001635 [Cryptotrichosporon argae]